MKNEKTFFLKKNFIIFKGILNRQICVANMVAGRLVFTSDYCFAVLLVVLYDSSLENRHNR